jgi:uncharacterized membrane protein (TIGR02234 family)
VTVTGQDLVPAASALAIAGLATLAAVIATRGLARRLAGGLLMLLGAAAAASVLWPVSEAAAIRAAASSAGLSGLAGSGTGAGSVTAGGSGGTGGTAPISGFLASVAMGGTAWRGLAVAGAALLVAAGLLTIWRSGPWPVMSSRYERPPRPAGPQRPVLASTALASTRLASTGLAAAASGAPAREPGAGPPRMQAADLSSAAIWESLSRGEDPTSDPER